MMFYTFLVIALISFSEQSENKSLNILGIFPYEGKSHFFVFEQYLQELALRGHNVKVISHFPQKTALKNYHDISLAGKSKILEDVIPMDNSYATLWQIINFILSVGSQNCRTVLEDENVQNLWKTKTKLDVILVEQFNSDCALGIAYKLGAPVVGLISHAILPWHYDRFGIPNNPAFIPSAFFGGGTKPSFYQRIERTLSNEFLKIFFKIKSQTVDQNTLAEYIVDVPPLEELAYDIKFLLTYTNFVLFGSSLHPRNIIEVNGYHVKKPKPLPEWVPAHIGIRGNEEADRLAKLAVSEGTVVPINPYYSEVLYRYKRLAFSKYKEYFDERSKNKGIWYKILQNQPSSLPWFVAANMSRQLIVLALRIRSGHFPSRSYGFLMKKEDTPDYEICRRKEDSYHLLMECARNENERDALMREFNDLKKFIDESKHGVIMISFGSMLKASTTPVDKVKAIIEAVSTLPQRVIWKWEEKSLPGNPKNIYISNWLPQNDILANPKVLAFYSHCGLLSTTEAIYHGVPIVGMPVFGDQPSNAAAIEERGFGVQIQLQDVTKENLVEKFSTVLNPTFRKRVKELSNAWHDRPTSAMESAVCWTEFAARHGNLTFRAPSATVPFYQYHGLDILGFLLLSTITIVLIIKYFVSMLISLIFKSKGSTKPKVNKEKLH